MTEGSSIARADDPVTSDDVRTEMLSALMDGRARTAIELAAAVGVTRAVVESRLGVLLDAGLIEAIRQGSHHYFRLRGGGLAPLPDDPMLAHRSTPAPRTFGPREPALRKARICYGHLAGELGVLVHDGLLRGDILRHGDRGLEPTERGSDWFGGIGIDTHRLVMTRRPSCRECLDWSERRYHLGGSIGAALLGMILERGWARRMPQSRAILFTTAGECSLQALVQAAQSLSGQKGQGERPCRPKSVQIP